MNFVVFCIFLVSAFSSTSCLENPEFEEYKMLHPEEFSGMFQGDMNVERSFSGFRNAYKGKKKWRNGILYYDVSAMKPETQEKIVNALEVLQKRVGSCIQFKKRTTEPHYVVVHSGDGCNSNVGRMGGKQKLSLNDPGCLRPGTIQHEFLHALGFVHEQSRSDRDQYLDIHWENIDPLMRDNFEVNPTDNLGLGYKYASVMHYGKYAFSKNGKPTMVPKDPKAEIGLRELTDRDVEMVRRYYGCYVPQSERQQQPCVDEGEDCMFMKSKCRKYLDLTARECEKTCGFCEGTALEPEGCVDNSDSCTMIKKNCASRWFKKFCKKTCNLC